MGITLHRRKGMQRSLCGDKGDLSTGAKGPVKRMGLEITTLDKQGSKT